MASGHTNDREEGEPSSQRAINSRRTVRSAVGTARSTANRSASAMFRSLEAAGGLLRERNSAVSIRPPPRSPQPIDKDDPRTD